MNSGFSRFCCALALACLVPTSTRPAHASNRAEQTQNQILELNKKALAAYADLDVETAAKLLRQALDLCKSADLERHPTAARTHVHLGVVLLADPKHRKLGVAEFRAAIAIDPRIRIARSLSNPEVQAAFEEALLAGGVLANPPASLPYSEGAAERSAAGPPAGAPTFASRISHPPVTQAFRNRPVAIKAHVPPGLGAAKIVLAYRAQGGPEFLAREMIPVGGNDVGWFRGTIPIEATHGSSVAYYIEARDANDEPIARSGAPESARHIALSREPHGEEAVPSASLRPGSGSARASPPPPPGFWFIVAVGTGGGYHSGTPEMHRRDTGTPAHDIKNSGFALAQLLHLAPEIGFFQTQRWVVSVQGRFQVVTGVDDALISGKAIPAARFALAGLAKLTWLPDAALSEFHPFLTVQAGAGQIRQSINLPRSSTAEGCTAAATCTDTMVGGLGLAGIGTGFTYALESSLAIYVAFNLLAGFPHFMVHGDLCVGLAIFR